MKVKLDDIVDCLYSTNDEMTFYYNKKTGKILFPDDEIEEDDIYVLPTKYDINDYAIMKKFIETIEDPVIKTNLYKSIRGRRPFRQFRYTCDRYNITKNWYKYRDDKYRQIAIHWCNEFNIEYE